MSVYQNIHGTLARIDASGLAQLAAVDTEGILGGTPGVITNGQTLVDQLAADDVRAQSDIGQIKTDLSDYHVVPSKNSLLWDKFVTNLDTNQSGTYSYNASTNILTVTSSSAIYSGVHLTKEKITEIFGLNSLTFPIVVSVSVKADKTCSYIIGSAVRSEYANLTANTWYRQVLTFNNSSALTAYNWAFYSNDTSQPTVEIKDMMVCTKAAWDANNTYEPYFLPMRDGKLDITDEQKLGAWNLLQNKGVSTTYPGGLSIIVNDDGTITLNGSDTSAHYFKVLSLSESYNLPNQELYLSGMPQNVGSNDFFLYLKYRNADDTAYAGEFDDKGGGGILNIPYGRKWEVYIAIAANTTLNNVVVKPMISLKPNMPYVPWTMTNAELTDAPNWNSANAIANNTDLNNLKDGRRHFCQSGSTASTLTHCPVSVAFILDVIIINSDASAFLQILQPIDGDKIFKRNYTGGAWGSWYKFTGTAV